MNKFFSYSVVFICITSVIAFFSKPEDDFCREETINKLKDEFTSNFNAKSFSNLANIYFTNNLKIEDKIFYKEVTLTFDKKSKTVAYGFFWNVLLR